VQEVPLGEGLCWQPCAASHTSVVQGFASLQLGAVPGVQAPPWQVSRPLQAFGSLHAAPLEDGVCSQPTPAVHVSAVQGLLSLQLTDVPDWHVPLWQASTPLQRLPSLHEAPFVTGVCWQPADGLQKSVVQ
jgi:hypothetical protein